MSSIGPCTGTFSSIDLPDDRLYFMSAVQHFLRELEASFNGKEGRLSEACWRPGLVLAVGELVRGRSWHGDIDHTGVSEQGEPSSGNRGLEVNVLTWEEVCECLWRVFMIYVYDESMTRL